MKLRSNCETRGDGVIGIVLIILTCTPGNAGGGPFGDDISGVVGILSSLLSLPRSCSGCSCLRAAMAEFADCA